MNDATHRAITFILGILAVMCLLGASQATKFNELADRVAALEEKQ